MRQIVLSYSSSSRAGGCALLHEGRDRPRSSNIPPDPRMDIERYLELCLRLGRHIDGLVDAYYGPAEISERVDAEELRDPAALAADAASLLASADNGWVGAQLVGLETVARKLAGEDIPYEDEV